MIPDHIYFCITRYQLLCMILHRMRFAEGTATVYIANLTLTDDEIDGIAVSLESSGLFDSVLPYDEKGFWNELAKSTVGTAQRDVAGKRVGREHLPEVKRRALERFKANLGEMTEAHASWYVAADHYSFGIALAFKGTSISQFEDHSGAVGKPYLLLNTMKKLNLFQFRVYEMMEAQRNASIGAHIVDSLSESTTWAHPPPAIELHVRKSLEALAPKQFNMIAEAFGYVPAKLANAGTDFTLLITQPFARWRFLDWASQKELYYTLVDYFAPNAELVIKPHPQDNLTPYRLWFPAASIAPANVPMELVLTQVKPSMALTVASTAIFQVPSTDARTVFLGQGFEQRFRQIPQLFAIATLFQWLGIHQVARSADFPAEALQSFMIDSIVIDVNEDGPPPVALACESLNSSAWPVTSSGVVVSLSPLHFADSDVTEFRLVVLRKPHGRAYTFQSLVYCYSRDTGRFDEIKGNKVERTLPNLREDLTIVLPVDGDPAFLQARIASLEKRVAELTSELEESKELSE
jgi:hypothetical protein